MMGKRREKGTTAQLNKDETTTDTECPSRSHLKKDVQTIIDIMGPPLSPNFNTSSEADNEESILSQQQKDCSCVDTSEKTESSTTANNNNSTAADLNTTSTVENLTSTDSKSQFPYVENFCNVQSSRILPDMNSQAYICPPPLLPANICVNSECFCPQVASILHGRGMPPCATCSNGAIKSKEKNKDDKDIGRSMMNWMKNILSSKHCLENCNSAEYYKMNIKRQREGSPPKRVVFELVNEVPAEAEFATKRNKNLKNEKLQATKTKDQQCFCAFESSASRKSKRVIEKTTFCDGSGKSRVDVYYFDHGSFTHYETTDSPPIVLTEQVADKTEKYTIRFWAEIFGTIHIGFSFATSFILQFIRFILYSLFRPLTIGILQLISDYFFKPFLVTVFNGIIQPILICLYNIFSSIRDLMDPVAEGIGYFIRELAVLVRAFRLIEYNRYGNEYKGSVDCNCDKKTGRKNRIVC